MHPDLNRGRQEARSQAQEQIHGSRSNVAYNGAACYDDNLTMVAVATNKNALITCASLRTSSAREAELAITLAITQCSARTVITDFRAACRSFLSGWVAPTALRKLQKHHPKHQVNIVWTLAYSSWTGNNFTHQQARYLAHRALSFRQPPHLS